VDVKTWWNLAPELLEQACRLQEFTCKRLRIPKYSHFNPLFTIQDELTIVKDVLALLRPCQYWTLWILKWNPVTFQYISTVDNDMFHHMDGFM
jgi:hypothetical protein